MRQILLIKAHAVHPSTDPFIWPHLATPATVQSMVTWPAVALRDFPTYWQHWTLTKTRLRHHNHPPAVDVSCNQEPSLPPVRNRYVI